jgi:lipid A 4'-phosphatase
MSPHAHADEAAVRRARLFAAASFLGFAAALAFIAFPEIDPWVSRQVFRDGAFILRRSALAQEVRDLLITAVWVLGVAAIAGTLAPVFKRRLFGAGLGPWLFLLLCVSLGPGLVANAVFKNEWGRPRPSQTTLFGGTQSFVLPLARSQECPTNCSFISGEASSVFAAALAVAMLLGRRRGGFLLALVPGALDGLVRIGQGAHFASDVVFAAAFMGLTTAFCHWLVFGLPARWRLALPRPGAPRRSEPWRLPQPLGGGKVGASPPP